MTIRALNALNYPYIARQPATAWERRNVRKCVAHK